MEIKDIETLKAEVERFKTESLKTHIVKVWAESYTNSDPFGYAILEKENNKVWWMKTQAHQLWEMWQAAKLQATPEGFVLVPVKEIKTWFLDESENIYREDPDWLCDIPIGEVVEVVEVEHRVSYELEQDPVFAAIQWDEINGDVGNYETFDTKEEAEKVAAHCKAMVEVQEQSHD
ncbi:hypothetical protein [Acinetobacter bereziniae]|uniref:hypothetical protein n=1 Tax=Acinetobacter bereziniae TaxID=106648 RepID=UPI0030080EF5